MKFFRFCNVALLLAISVNGVVAEESGAFIGLNLGYGDVVMQTNTSATEDNGDPTKSQNGRLLSGGGVNYGVVVGYKQFFTPHFGLRYYANISALHANLAPTALMKEHAGIGAKQNFTLLNYGANVDILANFVANKAFDVGAFVGLGIGGNSWFGKDLEGYPAQFMATNQITHGAWSAKKTHFSAWANIGLRTHFAHHHGVEIFARIPFVENVILKNNESVTGVKWRIESTLKSRYDVGVRYNFMF